jgi:hypothetical protein
VVDHLAFNRQMMETWLAVSWVVQKSESGGLRTVSSAMAGGAGLQRYIFDFL